MHDTVAVIEEAEHHKHPIKRRDKDNKIKARKKGRKQHVEMQKLQKDVCWTKERNIRNWEQKLQQEK